MKDKGKEVELNVMLILTGAVQRMWALKKLRKLMTTHFGPNINVSSLLASPAGEVGRSSSNARASILKLDHYDNLCIGRKVTLTAL